MQQQQPGNKKKTDLLNIEKPPEIDEPSEAGTSVSIAWTQTNEKIAVEWCDIAKCYKWLHYRSHQNFSTLQMWFTVPAIILSTISGTASFAQASLPVSMQTFAPMVIGSVNIFIGILTTIQQYLKISEYNESHRISAISWDKFSRNIKIELAKHPDDRAEDAGRFLKSNREEFDRLMETSPSIPPKIIDEFIATFSGDSMSFWQKCCKKKTAAQRKKKTDELAKRTLRFEALKKPDICNIIISADEDKYQWVKEDDQTSPNELLYSVVSQKITQIQDDMARKSAEIREEYENQIKQQEAKRAEIELAKLKSEKIRQEQEQERLLAEMRIQENTKKITGHISLFSSNVGRNPEKDEIQEALKDTVEADILERFLSTYESATYASGADNV